MFVRSCIIRLNFGLCSMPAPKTLEPQDFEVNQCWLAFRVNQFPIRTPEGEHDIYVLQDAGSMYIFGTCFAEHDAESPPESDVEALLQKAWKAREEWPDEIIVPGKFSKRNAFARAASQFGIAIRAVPEAQLSMYIKDVQTSFEEHLAKQRPEDA